jgi:membrane protein required for colicin V production
MNLYDIINLSIIIGSTLMAIHRGFLVSSINILSFVASILLTAFLFPFSIEIVAEYISTKSFSYIIAGFISYLLSKFTCSWLAGLFKELIEKISGGFLDRLFGIWIGGIQGLLMVFIIFLSSSIISTSSYYKSKNWWQIFSNLHSSEHPNWLIKSESYQYLISTHKIAINLIEYGYLYDLLENKIIMDNIPSTEIKDHTQDNLSPAELLEKEIITKNFLENEINQSDNKLDFDVFDEIAEE